MVMEAKAQFLYLHGFASGPNSNKASVFRERFAELNIPLVVPDLQGDDFKNLTISNQIERIREILSQSPCQEWGVIGSSMGGYLALLTAQLQSEVSAVYAMCPGLNFIERWKARLLKENPDWKRIPDLIRVFNYRYNKEMELSSRIFEDALEWEKVKLNRSLPTRIVHGTHDTIVGLDESLNYIKTRPWVEFQELDSDHGLLSHADWILDDSISFFEKQGLLFHS